MQILAGLAGDRNVDHRITADGSVSPLLLHAGRTGFVHRHRSLGRRFYVTFTGTVVRI